MPARTEIAKLLGLFEAAELLDRPALLQLIQHAGNVLEGLAAPAFTTAAAHGSSPWLVTKEAAEYLQTSPDTLRRLVREGHLQPQSVANRHLFHVDDLDGYLQQQRQVRQLPVTALPVRRSGRPAAVAAPRMRALGPGR